MDEKTIEQQIKEIFDIEDHATRFDELRKVCDKMERTAKSPRELSAIAVAFGELVYEHIMKDPASIEFSIAHKSSEIKAQKVLPTRTTH